MSGWLSKLGQLYIVAPCSTGRYTMYYSATSREAHFLRASLQRHTVDGVLVKVLWRQCFNKALLMSATYVDDRELSNWSKVMPMATMWQCFRVITCKACMHIMLELARARSGREISKNGGWQRRKNWKSHNISQRALRQAISTLGGHSPGCSS